MDVDDISYTELKEKVSEMAKNMASEKSFTNMKEWKKRVKDAFQQYMFTVEWRESGQNFDFINDMVLTAYDIIKDLEEPANLRNSWVEKVFEVARELQQELPSMREEFTILFNMRRNGRAVLRNVLIQLLLTVESDPNYHLDVVFNEAVKRFGELLDAYVQISLNLEQGFSDLLEEIKKFAGVMVHNRRVERKNDLEDSLHERFFEKVIEIVDSYSV